MFSGGLRLAAFLFAQPHAIHNRMATHKTCQYIGNLHTKIKHCTGTARKATAKDGSAYVNLWAFKLGGAGEVHWCREGDLKFFEAARHPK